MKGNKMKVTYEATIKISVIHDIDTLTDLKDNHQFATDICHMICDEASQAGGVACYEIIESKLDAKEDTEIINKSVYNDFMKNSRQ